MAQSPENKPYVGAGEMVDEPRDGSTAESRYSRQLWLAVSRYAAPALAAIALVLVVAGDGPELDNDLHLIAPTIARPGSTLPIRALLYSQLRAVEGPVLALQPIDVWLEAPGGHVLARTRLMAAASGSHDLEGLLALPTEPASLQLHARTRLGERDIAVSRPLTLRAELPEIVPEGRALRVLQQLAEGPLVAIAGETPPASLHVQIRGGACVPEEPCRALVAVGEPSATLRIEPNSAISDAKIAAPEDGVVALSFVTHGPEAELWLIAERAGRSVARQATRLPIAMAATSLQSALIAEAGQPVIVRGHSADGGCIVDAFRAGNWVATGSLASCDRDTPLPFALSPGLYRLQIRRDAFSAQTAGVALVYLRATGETPAQIVTAFARAAQRVAGDDSLVQRVMREPGAHSGDAVIGYLSALLETGIIEPPRAVASYADSLAELGKRRERMQNLALIALGLGAASLVLSIGRSGFSAGVRASRLLQHGAAGETRRARWRSAIIVVASLCSLVLVFIVIGLYVLARKGY